MNDLLKNRFLELANRSYQNNVYTFTEFLGLMETSVFHETKREISYVDYTIYGGAPDTERVVIRFGSQEALGYTEDFPICCLQISPLISKFSDALTHRDFLGALMNLGIERSTLGDLFIKENTAYLFCLTSIADYIIENLTRVKHTSVKICRIDCPETLPLVEKESVSIAVSSPRIDAITARVYNLSRSDSLSLFAEERIFLNGKVCTDPGKTLSEGAVISARGFGRFTVCETGGTSRKGKTYLRIEKNKS